MTIIETENLNLWYGEKQALKDVSVGIEKNKITALIGPSGCGKSTLLRCLNRMNDLIPNCRTEGTIKFDGDDVSSIGAMTLRKHVGMVFQRPNPFPMSIKENVAYAPRLHGETDEAVIDEIVEDSLTRAALWDEVEDRLDKPALSLSGGQQQRLCIARALSVSPEVLLMDEPTSALDPIATAKIEDLALSLAKDYTVVIVTHSMQQASRISDYTGFMYLGEMIEFGGTEKLFTRPSKELTERYVTGRFG